MHNSKSTYFLSSSCDSIEWIKKTKKVWAYENNCIMDLEFLWLSSINNYNNRIGNVDIANQNRSSYRLDRFMKKMKW